MCGMGEYLLTVEKPSRYINREINSVKKDPSGVRLRFGIAFPDTYEVGMSHLGMQILYQILNARYDIFCERVFCPWHDMEVLMRKRGERLTTLETKTPLSELHILGFSLQYELTYTNVLNILELGGIPLLAEERRDGDPIVIGGGPCALNPEPLSIFFDAFVLGDGEEVVLEIGDTVIEGMERGEGRDSIVERLAGIEGVYVPRMFSVRYGEDSRIEEILPLRSTHRVRRRIVPDLNTLPLPVKPVVPFTQAVHDRLSVEIARGCTRGCRFCQAGFIYRPLRERTPEIISEIVREGLRNTGYEEISLLSLSTGDYSSIEELLSGLMDFLRRDRTAISLPSLRVGTLSGRVAEEIRRVKKTGFTLAPEAGSPGLRKVINKEISEEALIRTVKEVVGLGWRAIKLYFMIGLPTETDEDVAEIARLVREVVGVAGRGRFKVSVSVSTFVPKPFTPFQWVQQIEEWVSRERLRFLRDRLSPLRVDFRWHDTRMSILEGVFARGDRRLGRVLLRAFTKGCRFDGWADRFDFERWRSAFREEGMDMGFYVRERSFDEILPWDHIDAGIDKKFLLADYRRALSHRVIEDCRYDTCTGCGVCDFETIRNVVSERKGVSIPLEQESRRGDGYRKIRLRFSKRGELRFLSHLELVSTIVRTIRRAGIRVRYSQGFNPLPRISFSPPLGVGIESLDEYMDMEIEDRGMDVEALIDSLNRRCPEGIRFIDGHEISLKERSPSAMIKSIEYLVFLKNGPLGLNIEPERIDGILRDIERRDSIPLTLERAKRRVVVDIKPLVEDITLVDATTLRLVLRRGERGSVRPREVVAHLFDLSEEDASLIPVLKTKAVFG